MRRLLADVVSVKFQKTFENAAKTNMQMAADASVQKIAPTVSMQTFKNDAGFYARVA